MLSQQIKFVSEDLGDGSFTFTPVNTDDNPWADGTYTGPTPRSRDGEDGLDGAAIGGAAAGIGVVSIIIIVVVLVILLILCGLVIGGIVWWRKTHKSGPDGYDDDMYGENQKLK